MFPRRMNALANNTNNERIVWSKRTRSPERKNYDRNFVQLQAVESMRSAENKGIDRAIRPFDFERIRKSIRGGRSTTKRYS
mmetsp:Transcript_5720/g.11380  ORF Transcript_5720/g.11380 Transcript_5720/m.11380 type:complete len:81 (+) Transcript_5720:3582-3824(+)